MAVTGVQFAEETSYTLSGTPITKVFNTGVAAGNGIVVGVFWKNNVTVTGVTDDQGNTYVDCGAGRLARPTDGFMQIYGATNVVGGGGSPTISVAFTGAVTEAGVVLREYTGQHLTTLFDSVFGTGTASSGTSVTTGSFTPTVTNGAVFAYSNTDDSDGSVGSGYSLVGAPVGAGAITEEKFFTSAPGSQTAVVNMSASITKGALIAAVIRAAAGGVAGLAGSDDHVRGRLVGRPILRSLVAPEVVAHVNPPAFIDRPFNTTTFRDVRPPARSLNLRLDDNFAHAVPVPIAAETLPAVTIRQPVLRTKTIVDDVTVLPGAAIADDVVPTQFAVFGPEWPAYVPDAWMVAAPAAVLSDEPRPRPRARVSIPPPMPPEHAGGPQVFGPSDAKAPTPPTRAPAPRATWHADSWLVLPAVVPLQDSPVGPPTARRQLLLVRATDDVVRLVVPLLGSAEAPLRAVRLSSTVYQRMWPWLDLNAEVFFVLGPAGYWIDIGSLTWPLDRATTTWPSDAETD